MCVCSRGWVTGGGSKEVWHQGVSRSDWAYAGGGGRGQRKIVFPREVGPRLLRPCGMGTGLGGGHWKVVHLWGGPLGLGPKGCDLGMGLRKLGVGPRGGGPQGGAHPPGSTL